MLDKSFSKAIHRVSLRPEDVSAIVFWLKRGCVYCYANTNKYMALRNYERHDSRRDMLAGRSPVSGTSPLTRRDSSPDGSLSLDL